MKTCTICGEHFSVNQIIDGKNHRLRSRNKCLRCLPLRPIYPETSKTPVQCKNCSGPFVKKWQLNAFCSKTCSTTYNNKHRPKKVSTCICGSVIPSRRKLCDQCKIDQLASSKTLEFFHSKKKDASRYSLIRYHAKKVTSNRPQQCEICGYSKHVETCHKKEIQFFPLSALISEINHPDNLSLLCPTHHWEMDHNMLDTNLLTMRPPGSAPGTSPLSRERSPNNEL